MRKFTYKPIYLVTLGMMSLLNVTNTFAVENRVIVNKAVKHDLSLPLRDLKANTNALEHYFASQTKPEETMTPTLLIESLLIHLSGFQGIGMGLGNYQVTSPLADDNAGIGITQYVQYANSDIAVFNKATGQPAPGFPKSGKSLWAGFGGVCEANAAGPMAIKHDQLANRWVIGQYATADINNGPFAYCIAVSTSEDATGTYHRYMFEFNSLSNYARLALWPDGYYTSFNMLGPTIRGPLICAYERDKMLAGMPANNQCVQIDNLASGPLIPADLTGQTRPPAGNPEYFLGLFPPSSVSIFKFHVNFINPNHTTVETVSVPVAAYVEACSSTGGKACAIQPNTTNRLDVHSDRFMNRVAYRQFFDHGSMVATHTVEGPTPKFAPALRWYEFRLTNGDPTFNPIVYQQATLAPDSKNRFLGSIAIDRFGNIALGYNVTSSLIYPSLELAYHNFNADLNTLTIQPLVTGMGSQINGETSWGADSKMLVDPVDQCTFWYSNQYLKSTGSNNWSTFIMKFKLAACS